MQELINRVEGLPPPEPTFTDELATHLDTQAHPLPHPDRYEHGYIGNDPVMLTTVDGKKYTIDEWCRIHAAREPERHPGPITMEERGSWNWGAITGAVLLLAFWAGVTYPTWSRWIK